MENDKRFDNIICEFGEMNLGDRRFMETLVAGIHGQMNELNPLIVRISLCKTSAHITYIEAGKDTIAG